MILWIIFFCFNSSSFSEELKVPVGNSFIYGKLEKSNNNHLVLIISGSGPTDRNGNSSLFQGDNNSLKYLAEEITIRGFDTFRYDKRMVGKSKNFPSEDSTIFYDFVNDAAEIVEYLNDNYKYEKISVIGHSEGALIGGLLSQKVDADNFILLCGMIEEIDTTIIKQITDRAPFLLDTVKSYFDTLNTGKKLTNINMNLTSMFRPNIQNFLIDMLKYKPKALYKSVKSNILFIGGGDDIQVKGENIEAIANEIGVQYKIFPEMNHVLKKSPKDYLGQLNTYSNPDLPLYEGLVDEIVNFLNEEK